LAGIQEPPSSPFTAGEEEIVFAVTGPIVRSDIPALCARAVAALADIEPGRSVVCDVAMLGTPDSVTLDALARLQLTARRMGHEVHLRNASRALRGLVVRAGLCDVILLSPDSGIEP